MQKIVCNDAEECECNLGYYANFEYNDIAVSLLGRTSK